MQRWKNCYKMTNVIAITILLSRVMKFSNKDETQIEIATDSLTFTIHVSLFLILFFQTFFIYRCKQTEGI